MTQFKTNIALNTKHLLHAYIYDYHTRPSNVYSITIKLPQKSYRLSYDSTLISKISANIRLNNLIKTDSKNA